MTNHSERPACPACKAQELKFEVSDRHQCLNCGYRVLIDDAGNVKDFMPLITAGTEAAKRHGTKRHADKQKPLRLEL